MPVSRDMMLAIVMSGLCTGTPQAVETATCMSFGPRLPTNQAVQLLSALGEALVSDMYTPNNLEAILKAITKLAERDPVVAVTASFRGLVWGALAAARSNRTHEGVVSGACAFAVVVLRLQRPLTYNMRAALLELALVCTRDATWAPPSVDVASALLVLLKEFTSTTPGLDGTLTRLKICV